MIVRCRYFHVGTRSLYLIGVARVGASSGTGVGQTKPAGGLVSAAGLLLTYGRHFALLLRSLLVLQQALQLCRVFCSKAGVGVYQVNVTLSLL